MCLCITLKHVISLGRVYSSKQDPPRAAPTGKTKVACVIKLPIPSKRHKAYVCTYVRYTFDYILYTEGTSVGRGPNPSRGPPGPSVQRRGPPVVIVPFPYRPRPHRDIYIYIYIRTTPARRGVNFRAGRKDLVDHPLPLEISFASPYTASLLLATAASRSRRVGRGRRRGCGGGWDYRTVPAPMPKQTRQRTGVNAPAPALALIHVLPTTPMPLMLLNDHPLSCRPTIQSPLVYVILRRGY